MAIPFYNQGDQDIYAGGEHFIPQEQYRLNYTPSTTLASTVGNTGGVTGTQANTAATSLVKLMARALYRIPNMAMGRAAFYMNRTVHSGMAISALDKSQSVLSIQEGLSQFGSAQSYLSFLGVPLRRVDALLNTESAVA